MVNKGKVLPVVSKRLGAKPLSGLVMALTFALATEPVLADVRAGVDAWSRGDYSAAVKEWEAPAAQGDADAQFNMGQAYKWGKGVKQDLKKAELFFGKAAAQGHPAASDNYGLLLFDRGERAMAMPYVKNAAARGDARAQYLLAIAHFNGDIVEKDWVRAYALMTLSRNAGLPQALTGMQQMDGFIPLEQRQQGVSLSQQLAAETEANRSRQLAASDLGVPNTPLSQVGAPRPASVAQAPRAPQPSPEEAVSAAERVAGGSSPASAGADFARPKVATAAPKPVTYPTPKPITLPSAGPAPQISAPPAPKSVAASVAKPVADSGTWRLQFGAFGVASNADALWAKLRARPEVAGHPRVNVPVGAVTKLQAGGYSEEAAKAACAKLSGAGFTCIAVKG